MTQPNFHLKQQNSNITNCTNLPNNANLTIFFKETSVYWSNRTDPKNISIMPSIQAPVQKQL